MSTFTFDSQQNGFKWDFMDFNCKLLNSISRQLAWYGKLKQGGRGKTNQFATTKNAETALQLK